MKRRSIKLNVAYHLLLCTVIVSCTTEQVVEQTNTDEVSEQGFSMDTRTTSGGPQYRDAYTLVSYKVGGTSSAYIDRYQIRDPLQYGYYAYDDGSLSTNAPGTLVPVAIKFPAFGDITPYPVPPMYAPSLGSPTTALTADFSYAQKLNSVPVTGQNTTTMQGVYRTAVIHPAVPMYDAIAYGLGYLAVFERTDDVFASMPDDADGQGTPFEIEVTSNAQVHPLPNPTNLYPIKSAVKLWFYSEYYNESDVLQEHPQEQPFTITSLKLYNVGSNGWYNARTGIIYPNYNYRNSGATNNYRTVYSSDEVGSNIPNYADLLPEIEQDNATPGPGAAGNKIQYHVETPVFPTDYRGSEGGGPSQIKTLTLALVLQIGSASNKASVPIALKMEKGKRYNFYINIMSEMIAVKYSVADWNNGGGGSNEIGGYTLDYATIHLEYLPTGWNNGGGGSNTIGN